MLLFLNILPLNPLQFCHCKQRMLLLCGCTIPKNPECALNSQKKEIWNVIWKHAHCLRADICYAKEVRVKVE